MKFSSFTALKITYSGLRRQWVDGSSEMPEMRTSLPPQRGKDARISHQSLQRLGCPMVPETVCCQEVARSGTSWVSSPSTQEHLSRCFCWRRSIAKIWQQWANTSQTNVITSTCTENILLINWVWLTAHMISNAFSSKTPTDHYLLHFFILHGPRLFTFCPLLPI